MQVLKSQSPQIGSMFLTFEKIYCYRKASCSLVAIPSNRVNVSYRKNKSKKWSKGIFVAIPSNRVNVSYLQEKGLSLEELEKMSQSPQIGSMFLTDKMTSKKISVGRSRNPLKSGQCFLRKQSLKKCKRFIVSGRNPLKSGQCFLRVKLLKRG